jgi:hypothetical protein
MSLDLSVDWIHRQESAILKIVRWEILKTCERISKDVSIHRPISPGEEKKTKQRKYLR